MIAHQDSTNSMYDISTDDCIRDRIKYVVERLYDKGYHISACWKGRTIQEIKSETRLAAYEYINTHIDSVDIPRTLEGDRICASLIIVTNHIVIYCKSQLGAHPHPLSIKITEILTTLGTGTLAVENGDDTEQWYVFTNPMNVQCAFHSSNAYLTYAYPLPGTAIVHTFTRNYVRCVSKRWFGHVRKVEPIPIPETIHILLMEQNINDQGTIN
jgi:hypothetical protein